LVLLLLLLLLPWSLPLLLLLGDRAAVLPGPAVTDQQHFPI
jgi:hypothetical protein